MYCSIDTSHRNLIKYHITPGIGEINLSQLDEQAVTDFYESPVLQETEQPVRLVLPSAAAAVHG